MEIDGTALFKIDTPTKNVERLLLWR